MQPPFSLRQRGTFHFLLCFVFALAERENKTQKEDQVPLRKDQVWATTELLRHF